MHRTATTCRFVALALVLAFAPACANTRQGCEEAYQRGLDDAQLPIETMEALASDGNSNPVYAAVYFWAGPRNAQEIATNQRAPADAIALIDLRDVRGLSSNPPFTTRLLSYFLHTPGSAPITVFKSQTLIDRESDPGVLRLVRLFVDEGYPVRVLPDGALATRDPATLLPLHPRAFSFSPPRFRAVGGVDDNARDAR